MTDLKKTPLYSLHLELSAKMVAFAGYQMPVQYATGIIKEHLHCREQVGFFDISHMGQCLIQGQSVAEELEKLTPSNICGLKVGQQRYTILTNKDGGIIDDIIVTRTINGFSLIVNAGRKEKDFAHLQQHLSKQCTLEIMQDQALFALQGPAAAHLMSQLSAEAAKLLFMQSCSTQIIGMPCSISRCGYTGEDGFEISIPNQHALTMANHLLSFDNIKPIGLGARDTLRLEAGLSLYGHELNESISPVEAGLKWTFRKKNLHFMGSQIINAQLNEGCPRKRVGLIIDGKRPIRQGCELFDEHERKIGIVSSGTFSPSLGKPIALALIDNSCQANTLTAMVRNQKILTQVNPLPFVPHRYLRA